MRLFFGVAIPGEVRSGLARRLSADLGLQGVRMTPPESFHLTLRFLGEVAAERLAAAEIAGRQAARGGAFTLHVAGAGVFPTRRRPRLFWAGVGGDTDRLRALASALDAALDAAGFPSEGKAYSPHLTLARTRGAERLDERATRAFESSIGDHRSEPFETKEFHLYHSQPGPSGARYEIVRTFPLA